LKRIYLFSFIQLLSIHSFCLEISSSQLHPKAGIKSELVVYSVLSNKAAEPLINAFHKIYPNISIKYDGDFGSNEINARFEEDIKSTGFSADVMWSSAVDTQLNYVKNGFAQPYRPKDSDFLPDWAKHKNLAWGTTFEPVVMVFNKTVVPGNLIPQTHDEFISLLKSHSEFLSKKVTLFDTGKSSVGMFFKSQDLKHYSKANDLYQQLSLTGAIGSAGTGEMLKKINSAEFLFGYNIMGSYALSRSKRDLQNLSIIYPKDYTLVLTRIAFISKYAKNPRAAAKWIDFLISIEGQKILADEVELNSIRSDIDSNNTSTKLSARIGPGVTPVDISH